MANDDQERGEVRRGAATRCPPQQLLEGHRPYVEGICRRFLGADEAADAAQEALIRASRRLHTLHDAGKIRPWLAVIARHACDDLLRTRLRGGPPASDLAETGRGGPLGAPTHPGPEAGVLDAAGVACFWDALRETLTPETCFILHCAYALEMTAEEIGRQIGMEPGTVRARKSRALPAVRAAAARCLGPAESSCGERGTS